MRDPAAIAVLGNAPDSSIRAAVAVGQIALQAPYKRQISMMTAKLSEQSADRSDASARFLFGRRQAAFL